MFRLRPTVILWDNFIPFTWAASGLSSGAYRGRWSPPCIKPRFWPVFAKEKENSHELERVIVEMRFLEGLTREIAVLESTAIGRWIA
mgnify:CR=1 FL=1